MTFKREFRYYVAKAAHVPKYLTPQEHSLLNTLFNKLPPLECVCIESDWPIYEEAWALVERLAEEEAAEKAKDSERLEWLISVGGRIANDMGGGSVVVFGGAADEDAVSISGNTPREAIDKAMRDMK